MKVLFLDVDGVLNKHSDWDVLVEDVEMYRLNKMLVEKLMEIVILTSCEIVLSSTWRKDDESIIFLNRILSDHDISLLGATSHHSNGHRGTEVEHWLERHPGVSNYAILDDDGDFHDHQLKNFFQTDPEFGLTDTLVYRVSYHLNKVVDKKS